MCLQFCHMAFQFVLAAWLMTLSLADLRALYLNLGLFDLAASFAASSAFSFPVMSMCPGIQTNEMSMLGSCILRESTSSRRARITDCPDWRSFIVAIMADW